jgi:hypothetical protein
VDEAKVTIDGLQIAIGLDNLYRIAMGQDGTFPQGLRGRWENEDTFVVESILLGQMVQTMSQVQFSREAIHITWQEKYSGSNVEIQGALNPVAK